MPAAKHTCRIQDESSEAPTWETDISLKGFSSNLNNSLHCIPHEPLHSLSHLNCFPAPGCQLVCHPAMLVGNFNDIAANLSAKLDAPCMEKGCPNALKHLRAKNEASSFSTGTLRAWTMAQGVAACLRPHCFGRIRKCISHRLMESRAVRDDEAVQTDQDPAQSHQSGWPFKLMKLG